MGPDVNLGGWATVVLQGWRRRSGGRVNEPNLSPSLYMLATETEVADDARGKIVGAVRFQYSMRDDLARNHACQSASRRCRGTCRETPFGEWCASRSHAEFTRLQNKRGGCSTRSSSDYLLAPSWACAPPRGKLRYFSLAQHQRLQLRTTSVEVISP